MEIRYNVTGPERKRMVQTIETITGLSAKYLGMPSAAFEIGPYTVTKDGTLKSAGWDNKLVRALSEAGFDYAREGFALDVPTDEAAVGNLTKLLDAKGSLIRKALGLNEIPVDITDDTITFPWLADAGMNQSLVYKRFIKALCRFSKEAKRVSGKEKPTDNEKYTFRCFLLRLGYIGPEYKADRKILLQNLIGSSAFRNGGEITNG